MTRMFSFLFVVLQLIWSIKGQQNPYSLQSAVDALHRREAQLALKEYENSRVSNDEGYFNDEPAALNELQKQQQLNTLLARYLDTEEDERGQHAAYEPEFEDNQYGFDERKRSIFRERGGDDYEVPYQSVFREREYSQPDLAAEFLKEIDHERNLEREEKYKENLRRLWEKYQQQENEIEQDLFDEEKINPQKGSNHPYMAANTESRPQQYYGSVVEKRRLVLPWLPATRRKRFPVAKRSPKFTKEDAMMSGTDEKVARDLQAIFGEPIEEKRKRSSDTTNKPTATTTPSTEKPHKIEKKSDNSIPLKPVDETHHDDHKNDDNDGHNHEHNHEHDLHDSHEDEDKKFGIGHTDNDDDDIFDSIETDKKKKRAAVAKRSNPEILKEDQIIPGDLSDFRKKKSIQWSKYFGLDRRKKSVNDWYMNELSKAELEKSNQGSAFAPTHFHSHDESSLKNDNELNEMKLNNMDLKLKTIENLIIDETIKYTGAHEGLTNPDDIQRLKDHVISRLATAYSLEKMRRALEKLKQSVELDRHLEHNEIEDDKTETTNSNIDKDKRVAVKKEKVQFDNNHHMIESATEKINRDVGNNALEGSLEDQKMKKKRLMLKPYPDYNEIKNALPRPAYSTNELSDNVEFEDESGAGHFEPLSEEFMGGANRDVIMQNQCPLLDGMEKRCRSVDLISGDVYQELLPICEIHQLCYLCGTSQTSCDFQYLSEVDSICGHNKECQSAARGVLMILRESPGPQLGPRECAKNSCLNRAMRDIGV